MEIKMPEIKSMKYEDFNDNEYLEKMAREYCVRTARTSSWGVWTT